MNRLRILVTLCLFTCGACIDIPEVVDPPRESPLQVHFASPSATTLHTNGDVSVQVVVSGGEAERVEVLLEGEVLVSLSPPYQYTWSTQSVPEGRYSLVARATKQGAHFASEARTVVVDRTPPQVVSRTPAPGTQDASVRAPIRIEFSEPLLRSSVSEGSFSVTAGSTVLGFTLRLAEHPPSVELSLSQLPPVPTEFVVTSSSLLTDAAGNRAVIPALAWSWHASAFVPLGTRLHAGEGLGVDSSLSVAFDGRSAAPVLAWSEKAGTLGNDIFVRRLDGSEWVDLGMLPRLADTSSRLQPKLLVKDDGQLLLGFLDYGEGGFQRVVVAALSAESWQAVGPPFRCIPPDGSIHGFFMTLGLDQQPIVAVSDFDTSTPTEGRVYVCRFSNGKWEAVGTPLGTTGSGSRADIWGLEADAAGHPVVLWSQGGVFYIEQWDGTRWAHTGRDIRASVGTSLAGASLTMSRDGIPYIAWAVSSGDGRRRLHVARDTPVDLIGTAEMTGTPQVAVSAPWLRLDEQGRLVAFWSEHDSTNGRATLRMKRWLGSQWADTALVTAIPPHTGSGAFAVDDQGELLCAHPEFDGERNVIALKRFNR